MTAQDALTEMTAKGGLARYMAALEVVEAARRVVAGMGMGTQGHLDRLEAAIAAFDATVSEGAQV